jgi:hypothetical protein
VRLFRHLLFASLLPTLALVLASAFAPAAPPTASAATDASPATVVCHQGEPANWLDAILDATRALLC